MLIISLTGLYFHYNFIQTQRATLRIAKTNHVGRFLLILKANDVRYGTIDVLYRKGSKTLHATVHCTPATNHSSNNVESRAGFPQYSVDSRAGLL